MKKKLLTVIISAIAAMSALFCLVLTGCDGNTTAVTVDKTYVQQSELTDVLDYGGQTMQYMNTKELTVYSDGTYMMYAGTRMILNGGNGGMYYNIGFGTFTKESTDPSDPDCTEFKIKLSEPTRIISYNGYPWGTIPGTGIVAGYWDSADESTFFEKEDDNGNPVKYTYDEQLAAARTNTCGDGPTYAAEVTVSEEKYENGLPKGYLILEYTPIKPETPAE